MTHRAVLAPLALAACSQAAEERQPEVDIANSARAAQGSVDAYLAEQHAAANAARLGGERSEAVADYRCADGTRIRVTFDNARGIARLALPAGEVELAQQPAASGIHYTGGGHDLRGKGDAATITIAGSPPVDCTADPTPGPAATVESR